MKCFVMILSVVLCLLYAEQVVIQRCLPGMQGLLVVGIADSFLEHEQALEDGCFAGLLLSRYLKDCNKWTIGVGYMNCAFDYNAASLCLWNILRSKLAICET